MPDLMGVGAEASRIEYDEERASGKELLEILRQVMTKNLDPAISVTTDLVTASYKQGPPQVIVEEAALFDADLVIVGSRGMSTWKRWLVGSVSMEVVQHAHCSVEVVRSKG